MGEYFGGHIRQLCNTNGVTYKEIAELTSLGVNEVEKIACGDIEPSASFLALVFRKYPYDLYHFFGVAKEEPLQFKNSELVEMLEHTIGSESADTKLTIWPIIDEGEVGELFAYPFPQHDGLYCDYDLKEPLSLVVKEYTNKDECPFIEESIYRNYSIYSRSGVCIASMTVIGVDEASEDTMHFIRDGYDDYLADYSNLFLDENAYGYGEGRSIFVMSFWVLKEYRKRGYGKWLFHTVIGQESGDSEMVGYPVGDTLVVGLIMGRMEEMLEEKELLVVYDKILDEMKSKITRFAFRGDSVTVVTKGNKDYAPCLFWSGSNENIFKIY
jgi:transcriptional regulator with XRE-family HTH domain